MPASPDDDLKQLAAGLNAVLSRGDVTQPRVSSEVGVDQGFVSRAKRGQLKRLTPRARRLLDYVNMRLREQPLPEAVTDAAKAFLASGGDPSTLAEFIRLLLSARTG